MEMIQAFMALPFDEQIKIFLINFAWIPVAISFLWGAKEIWLFYINNQWGEINDKQLFLAIDIPKANEQSPKAAENMITYLSGAHGTFNKIEEYWEGKYQLSFSLEIVSIDGYTQFIVKTPPAFRNFVESAVYSQYPDAEITEIDDYTTGMPSRFPDDEWDCWGAEFIYAKNDAYPIKTWPEFENEIMGRAETQYKDPMASLMDLCSSLQKGEQLWYQILIKPTGFDWMDTMNKEVGKILKEKPSGKKTGPIGGALAEIKSLLDEFTNQLFSIILGGGSAAEDAKDDSLKMMNLKPQDKKRIEGIQKKISKVGFYGKNRMVYIAKKDVMNKPKVVNGFVGYMKQFIDLDLNNLKPDMEVTATSASYFFKESRVNTRKTKIVSAYKSRSTTRGRITKVFNVEELATLWHFPIEANVRAPLVQKTPGRKAEAPMTLPLAEDEAMSEKIFEPGADIDDIFLEDENGRVPSKNGNGQDGNDRPETAKDEENIFTLEDEDLAAAAEDRSGAKTSQTDVPGTPAQKVPAIVREARAQNAAQRPAQRAAPRGAPPANLPI